jgi:hypothetical protein
MQTIKTIGLDIAKSVFRFTVLMWKAMWCFGESTNIIVSGEQ